MVTPFDLINNENYTTEKVKNERNEICLGCERFIKQVGVCKECGCFMNMKTWLKDAYCPIGKWNSVD